MFPLRLALCFLLLLENPVLGSTQKIADRIYYGGDIVTADDTNPDAEAVAVRNGRIIGVGALAGIVRMRGADTELLNLDGRTLAPGFIDAHGHLSRTGLQAICANLLRPPHGRSRSVADIVQTLRRWKENPRARKLGLILGFGYEESRFGGNRRLTRGHLDAVSTELPVIAIHRSGNRSVFNSRALALAGFRGGSREGQDGVLEGTVHDFALRRVLDKLVKENVSTLIEAAQRLYIRFGHTTAQDSAPGPAALKVYSDLAASGRLKIDVVAYPDPLRDRDQALLPGPVRSRNYMNGFRIGGILLRFADPSYPWAARHGAPWLRRTSGPPGGTGGMDASGDTALLAEALRNGWQVIVRPRNARAAGRFYSAMRAMTVPGRNRPVLVHDRNLRPAGLWTLGDLGIAPLLLAGPLPEGEHAYGAGPGFGNAPAGPLVKEGVPFTAGHGAPDAPPNMLHVMAALVRQVESGDPETSAPAGPARMAALKAVTLWAARQYSEEETKGSISPGKLADLTILSANPLTAGPEALRDIRVMQTIKEGQTIFVRPEENEHPSRACADSAQCFSGITAALFRAGTVLPGVPPRRAASLGGDFPVR
ncbi:MAG: amidohydrolase [bacterium]